MKVYYINDGECNDLTMGTVAVIVAASAVELGIATSIILRTAAITLEILNNETIPMMMQYIK